MAKFAIIGGTGANLLPVELADEPQPATPWGQASACLTPWPGADAHEVLFLPRHGVAGSIAPHAVNYRANIDLLAMAGVDFVVALNAVGVIAPALEPGTLAIPHQLIDYTWGRAHTYYDDPENGLEFIEFTKPYSDNVRDILSKAADSAGLTVPTRATYAVTQGPRLETAAEIDRLERDGCDLVGMTAMPEAALARERGLDYAGIALLVNRAAGRGGDSAAAAADEDLHAEMAHYLESCTRQVGSLLDALRSLL